VQQCKHFKHKDKLDTPKKDKGLHWHKIMIKDPICNFANFYILGLYAIGFLYIIFPKKTTGYFFLFILWLGLISIIWTGKRPEGLLLIV
jgi:hypothetical protein